jgi:DNA-directed RNA polymerase
MSKDEDMASYCNLVPSELPGDLYAFVGDKVREELEYEEAKLPNIIYNRFDEIFDGITNLQEDYNKAVKGSDLKVQTWEAVQTFRNNNRKLREWLFPVYWNRLKDDKVWRKSVKRPVMSLGYGSTSFGMGQQIWDDTRELDPYLAKQEKLWSSMLGSLIYRVARRELKGPGRLLALFETIADRFNDKQENLAWKTPITEFPVVQNYRKPVSDRTLLKHGDEQLKVVIENWDQSVLDKDSQRLGASPNIVHSLDATHMMMTIDQCGFNIAPIHDSWGCVAGNMSTLFATVRSTFVQLYGEDPLHSILTQLDCLDLEPERGSLDVAEILNSDFAFC